MSDPTPSRPYTPPDDPRLPRFSSYQEEAAFWDTHDVFDLSALAPDEQEERGAMEQPRGAERNRRAGLTAQLTIRLDRETYDRIAVEARALGIGPTTLARIWLRERLRPRRLRQEEIPGPPPRLIVVGQRMSDSWLVCFIRRDVEGQTYQFQSWGEIRRASFRGYPVECWTPEADAAWAGQRTEGIIAQVYGTNRDGQQFVRFTYRIQLDGDYVNNCRQEILEQP